MVDMFLPRSDQKRALQALRFPELSNQKRCDPKEIEIMPVVKAKKQRASVWDNDARPYGVNDGPWGNPGQWKRFRDKAMGLDEANSIVREDSPWTILGLNPKASWDEIKKAFRELVKKVHPDVGGTAEEFRKVYAAYVILKERANK
jgi:hypothetical protein